MGMLELLAQSEKVDPGSIGLSGAPRSAESVISNVLTTTYIFAGIVCVLIIVIAGYYYVTSSGDSAGITRAKQAIIGAVVGVIVVMSAFVITQFVLGRF